MNHYKLVDAMITYYSGDPERIQHLIKVWQFAAMIADEEGLSEDTRFILETASIVHDIGIRIAEEKYGSFEGPLQEKEGPPQAERMLADMGYDEDVIARVSYLVGHHHTYTDVDGMDYQILLEADFLVNMYEEGQEKAQIAETCDRIFRTETGKRLCKTMFAL